MACDTQRQSRFTMSMAPHIHMSQIRQPAAENVQSRGNEPSRNLLCLFSCSHTPPQPRLSRVKFNWSHNCKFQSRAPRVCRAAISFSCRIYISQQFRQRRFHVTDGLHFSSCEALYLIGKLLASLIFPLFCCHLVCLRTLHRSGAPFFSFWADCRCAHSQALLRCPWQRKPSLPCYFN